MLPQHSTARLGQLPAQMHPTRLTCLQLLRLHIQHATRHTSSRQLRCLATAGQDAGLQNRRRRRATSVAMPLILAPGGQQQLMGPEATGTYYSTNTGSSSTSSSREGTASSSPGSSSSTPQRARTRTATRSSSTIAGASNTTSSTSSSTTTASSSRKAGVSFGPLPAVPGLDSAAAWVVFSDLHLSHRSVGTALEVLQRVHEEAQSRNAGVLFLGM